MPARDELRDLLDSSIQHLFKGYDILYAIAREQTEQRAGQSSVERLQTLGQQLQDETWLIAQHGLRVGLRVPADARLAGKQTEVNQIFLQYAFEYNNYLKEDPSDTSTLPPSPHKKAFAESGAPSGDSFVPRCRPTARDADAQSPRPDIGRPDAFEGTDLTE